MKSLGSEDPIYESGKSLGSKKRIKAKDPNLDYASATERFLGKVMAPELLTLAMLRSIWHFLIC